MSHTRVAYRTVTDPETGRVYPIPAGGADDAPPAGDETTDEPDTTTDDDAGDEEEDEGDDEYARLRSAIAKEREAAKAEKQRRKALQGELAKIRGESETEIERARREARDEILGPVTRALRTTAVENAASAFGFVDSSDAARLVDLDEIDVDEEDLVADADAARKAVERLAKAKPHLLTEEGRERLAGRSGRRQGGADTQSGNGTTPSSDASGSFMSAIRSKAGVHL